MTCPLSLCIIRLAVTVSHFEKSAIGAIEQHFCFNDLVAGDCLYVSEILQLGAGTGGEGEVLVADLEMDNVVRTYYLSGCALDISGVQLCRAQCNCEIIHTLRGRAAYSCRLYSTLSSIAWWDMIC